MPYSDLSVGGSRPELKKAQHVRKNVNGNLSFPSEAVPHSILFVFKSYSFQELGTYSLANTPFLGGSRSTGVSLRSVNSIELPFPKNLEDNYNLRVTPFERSKLGEAMGKGLNSALQGGGLEGKTVRDLGSLIQEIGAAAGGSLSNSGGVSGGLSSAINGFLNTELNSVGAGAAYLLRSKIEGTIGKTIDNITSQTVNPRETLAFEGVDLKQHSFNWDLYPSNKEDSELIRAIVRRIKQSALPVAQDVAGMRRVFLQYPSTVDAYLLGVNPEHFIKYKTSMITDFSVNYGAGGLVSIAKGGKPAGVSLSMNMMELDIHTADEFGPEPVELERPAQTDNAAEPGRPAGPGGNGGV